MTDPVTLLPEELAYVFSYMKVSTVIGWGDAPFAPPAGGQDAFYARGLERLKAEQRLIPGKEPDSWRFADAFLELAIPLSDPDLVLVAQRKAEGGIRTRTVHVKDDAHVALERLPSGEFRATMHPHLSAAVGAEAAFVGASREGSDDETRIEANQAVLQKLDELAEAGQVDKVVEALVKLGADADAARSAVTALAKPATSGVLSVFYTDMNQIQGAETFAVMTNAGGDTWIVFPPADADGPMVLERSSLASLIARVLVTVTARDRFAY